MAYLATSMPRAKKSKPEGGKPPESKAPSPAGIQPVKVKEAGHSVLDPDSKTIRDTALKVLSAVAARRKNKPVALRSVMDQRRDLMPVGHFMLQWLLGTYGLPQGSVLEIIGDKGTGKTTLALQLASTMAMATGAWTLFLDGENKWPTANRVARICGPDPRMASCVASNITMQSVNSLDQMWDVMQLWVNTMRGREKAVIDDGRKASSVCVTQPLIVIVDPWSGLMDPEQALGKFDYGANMQPAAVAKGREVGEDGRRGMAAKWAHDWCCTLPYFLAHNNVFLILVHHQNSDMDAAKNKNKATASLPKTFTELFNDTHRGGRATGQKASCQIIMVHKGQARAGFTSNGPVTGARIGIRCHKQSHGAFNRVIETELRSEHEGFDGPGYMDPPWQFDDTLAVWLAQRKLLGVTLESGVFYSEELGVRGGSGRAISQAVHGNAALLQRLGEQFRLEGYYDILAAMSADSNQEAVMPPAPAQDVEVVDVAVEPVEAGVQEDDQ